MRSSILRYSVAAALLLTTLTTWVVPAIALHQTEPREAGLEKKLSNALKEQDPAQALTHVAADAVSRILQPVHLPAPHARGVGPSTGLEERKGKEQRVIRILAKWAEAKEAETENWRAVLVSRQTVNGLVRELTALGRILERPEAKDKDIREGLFKGYLFFVTTDPTLKGLFPDFTFDTVSEAKRALQNRWVDYVGEKEIVNPWEHFHRAGSYSIFGPQEDNVSRLSLILLRVREYQRHVPWAPAPPEEKKMQQEARKVAKILQSLTTGLEEAHPEGMAVERTANAIVALRPSSLTLPVPVSKTLTFWSGGWGDKQQRERNKKQIVEHLDRLVSPGESNPEFTLEVNGRAIRVSKLSVASVASSHLASPLTPPSLGTGLEEAKQRIYVLAPRRWRGFAAELPDRIRDYAKRYARPVELVLGSLSTTSDQRAASDKIVSKAVDAVIIYQPLLNYEFLGWLEDVHLKAPDIKIAVIYSIKSSKNLEAIPPSLLPLVQDKTVRVAVDMGQVKTDDAFDGLLRRILPDTKAAGLEEQPKRQTGLPEFKRYEDFETAHGKIMAFAETAAFGTHPVGSGKEVRSEPNAYFGEAIWAAWTAMEVALSQTKPFFKQRGDLQLLLNKDLENLARYYQAHYEGNSDNVDTLPGAQAVQRIRSWGPSSAHVQWMDLFGNSLSWETVHSWVEQDLIASAVFVSFGAQERLAVVLEKPSYLLEKVNRNEPLPKPSQLGENLYQIGARIFYGKGGKAFVHVQAGKQKVERKQAKAEEEARHASPGTLHGPGINLKQEIVYPSVDSDPNLNHLRFIRHRVATLLKEHLFPIDFGKPHQPLVRALLLKNKQAEDLFAKAKLITPERPFVTEGDVETLIQEVFYFLEEYPDSADPVQGILNRVDKREANQRDGTFAQTVAHIVERYQAGERNQATLRASIWNSYNTPTAGLEELGELRGEIEMMLEFVQQKLANRGQSLGVDRHKMRGLGRGSGVLHMAEDTLKGALTTLRSISDHDPEVQDEMMGRLKADLSQLNEELKRAGIPPPIEIIQGERLALWKPRVVAIDWDDTVFTGNRFAVGIKAELYADILSGGRRTEADVALARKHILTHGGYKPQDMIEWAIAEGRKRGLTKFQPVPWYVAEENRLKDIEKEKLKPKWQAHPASVLIPGADKLVGNISAAGLPIYLVTSGRKESKEKEASIVGLGQFFKGIYGVTRKDPGYSKTKALREIIATEGITPDQLLVIGDGLGEIEAAKEVGAVAVGFAEDIPTRQGLIRAGADLIINYDFRNQEPILKALKISRPAGPPAVGDEPGRAGLEEQNFEPGWALMKLRGYAEKNEIDVLTFLTNNKMVTLQIRPFHEEQVKKRLEEVAAFSISGMVEFHRVGEREIEVRSATFWFDKAGAETHGRILKLRESKNSDALPALLAIIQDPNELDDVRVEAARALRTVPMTQGFEVERALEAVDELIRQNENPHPLPSHLVPYDPGSPLSERRSRFRRALLPLRRDLISRLSEVPAAAGFPLPQLYDRLFPLLERPTANVLVMGLVGVTTGWDGILPEATGQVYSHFIDSKPASRLLLLSDREEPALEANVVNRLPGWAVRRSTTAFASVPDRSKGAVLSEWLKKEGLDPSEVLFVDARAEVFKKFPNVAAWPGTLVYIGKYDPELALSAPHVIQIARPGEEKPWNGPEIARLIVLVEMAKDRFAGVLGAATLQAATSRNTNGQPPIEFLLYRAHLIGPAADAWSPLREAGLEEIPFGVLHDEVGQIRVDTTPLKRGPELTAETAPTLEDTDLIRVTISNPPLRYYKEFNSYKPAGSDPAAFWPTVVDRHRRVVALLKEDPTLHPERLQSQISAIVSGTAGLEEKIEMEAKEAKQKIADYAREDRAETVSFPPVKGPYPIHSRGPITLENDLILTTNASAAATGKRAVHFRLVGRNIEITPLPPPGKALTGLEERSSKGFKYTVASTGEFGSSKFLFKYSERQHPVGKLPAKVGDVFLIKTVYTPGSVHRGKLFGYEYMIRVMEDGTLALLLESKTANSLKEEAGFEIKPGNLLKQEIEISRRWEAPFHRARSVEIKTPDDTMGVSFDAGFLTFDYRAAPPVQGYPFPSFAVYKLEIVSSNGKSKGEVEGAGLEERPYLVSRPDYQGPVAIVGKGGGTTMKFMAASDEGLLEGTDVSGVTVERPGIDTQDQILDRMVDQVGQVIKRLGPDGLNRVMYVHISFPGYYDENMVLTRDQENIPGLHKGLDLKKEMEARLASKYPRPAALGAIPVIVVHDGTGHANGERSRFGRFPEAENLFFIGPGTGIATRGIVNGKAFTGGPKVQFLANEAPHTLVYNPLSQDYQLVILQTKGDHPDFTNRLLPTDQKPNPFYGEQDLEDRTSGPAIARYAAELATEKTERWQSPYSSAVDVLRNMLPQRDLRNLTAEIVGRAAQWGNPLALQAIQDRGRELGNGLAVLLVEFNRIWGDRFPFPEHIVLGGGVSQIGPIYTDAVKDGFRTRLRDYARKGGVNFHLSDVENLVAGLSTSAIANDSDRELLAGLPTKAQVAAHANQFAATGLEEAEFAGILFLSFDPAAARPLLQLGMNAYVVVPTPTDARQQLHLGVAPERLIGTFWGGLEEADYLKVNPGIRLFVSADPTVPGWQEEILRSVSSHNPGVRIVVISDAASLASGLEELGVPGTTVEKVLQARSKTQETLALMD